MHVETLTTHTSGNCPSTKSKSEKGKSLYHSNISKYWPEIKDILQQIQGDKVSRGLKPQGVTIFAILKRITK